MISKPALPTRASYCTAETSRVQPSHASRSQCSFNQQSILQVRAFVEISPPIRLKYKIDPREHDEILFAWRAGPVPSVSISARLNMSSASTQPATLRSGPASSDETNWLSIAETVATRLRETAVARERAAAPPHIEISWLRDAGLLTLLNPAQAGGGGASFSDAFRVVRTLARADTSIAQVRIKRPICRLRPKASGLRNAGGRPSSIPSAFGVALFSSRSHCSGRSRRISPPIRCCCRASRRPSPPCGMPCSTKISRPQSSPRSQRSPQGISDRAG